MVFEGLIQLAFIGPGGPEFLLVMLVLIMLFGAKDAPRILRKLNEIFNQIRNTADGFKREVMYGDLSSQTSDHPTTGEDEESGHDEDFEYTQDYDVDAYADDEESIDDILGAEEDIKQHDEADSAEADQSTGITDEPGSEEDDAPKT
jgi:sec-independent protein translocase protein TatA